ncbi:MAG: BamA/TamA family outer membrane protein [Chitinivibrionales bacterium]|nr:BamA/TamA family outer membrane protein [Chitinivibrionales bacterium]
MGGSTVRMALCMTLWVWVACALAADDARTHVEDITFAGNQTFERDELLRLMELQPDGLFSRSAFSRFKLGDDEEALRRFYRRQGFIDVEVSTDVVREGLKEGWVNLEITIEEGERVIVQSVSIAPNPVVDKATATFLETRVRQPYVESEVEGDASAISDSLRAAGFLAASVTSRVDIDTVRYRADVTFDVASGPRVIVGDIRVTGLETVRELVVRRELVFEPGDTLTTQRLRKSARQLYRTGLFSFARIEPMLGDSADTLAARDTVVPVVITLDQTDYFLVEAGLGYSSTERLRSSLRFAYSNFFRRGHRIVLDGELGSIEQGADLAYVTPWLFVIPLRTEVSAFYLRHDTLIFTPALGYSGEFAGFSVALGQSFNNTFAYRTLFRYENVLRLDAPSLDTLPPDVPTRNTRSLAGEVIYDLRNDIFTPTEGFYGLAGAEIAGIFGGNTNQFVKLTLDLRGYASIRDALFFASGLELGWAGAYGSSEVVPPQEQFFAGGPNSVRGYDIDRLVVDNGEPLGGNVKLVAHIIDFRFPLVWWFNGAVFVDAGFVWPDLESVSFSDIKFGAGPGLRLVTPLGMFRFDVGFKLNDPDRDPAEYYFVFGTAL